jgi:hypothetical protein
MPKPILPYVPAGDVDNDERRTILAYVVALLAFLPALLVVIVVFGLRGFDGFPVAFNYAIASFFFIGPALVVIEAVLLLAMRNRMNAGCGAWALTISAGAIWSYLWILIFTD